MREWNYAEACRQADELINILLGKGYDLMYGRNGLTLSEGLREFLLFHTVRGVEAAPSDEKLYLCANIGMRRDDPLVCNFEVNYDIVNGFKVKNIELKDHLNTNAKGNLLFQISTADEIPSKEEVYNLMRFKCDCHHVRKKGSFQSGETEYSMMSYVHWTKNIPTKAHLFDLLSRRLKELETWKTIKYNRLHQ